MSAQIIDGKKIASEIREELKNEITALQKKGVTPGLGVILVGDNPASKAYVSMKEKACADAGIYSDDNRLPESTSREELLTVIDRLNNDKKIHGILLQLPLPAHLDDQEMLLKINPDKDVDGFHPYNLGKLVIGQDTFLSCTPYGVVELLIRSGVALDGAHAVIVGRSNIVGKPLANMLIQKSKRGNATVTLCHTRTKDLRSHTLQADILIAAAGVHNAITADMVKDGAVVIDVGMNRVDDPSRPRGYRLTGDVDYDNVKEKASFITPVPGGVGPMTITMLLKNTVLSAQSTLSD